jgi:hypothetical protein
VYVTDEYNTLERWENRGLITSLAALLSLRLWNRCATYNRPLIYLAVPLVCCLGALYYSARHWLSCAVGGWCRYSIDYRHSFQVSRLEGVESEQMQEQKQSPPAGLYLVRADKVNNRIILRSTLCWQLYALTLGAIIELIASI